MMIYKEFTGRVESPHGKEIEMATDDGIFTLAKIFQAYAGKKIKLRIEILEW